MLVRHTLYYLPAQIVSPLVQLASILIWARLLSPEDLGLVTLVVAMQELAFVSFFMWWSHYALRFIARFIEVDERRAFLRSEAIAILASSAVQTAVMWPLLVWYFPEYMTVANAALCAAFMVTRSLSNYFSERARADMRIGLYTLMQIAGPVFGLGIGLAMMFRLGFRPEYVFAGFIIAQTAGLAIVVAKSDFGRSIGRPSREILSKAFAFGVPVMGAQTLAVVALNAPRFIVDQTLGLAAAGMFAVGYGLGLRASSFAVMLVTAGAYPLVVRKMETEGLQAAYAQLQKNTILVALAVMPVAFGLLAINHSVVDILVAEQLRAATYAVLPLTTVGGLFRYLRAHTTDQVFLIQSKPNYAVAIAVIDLTLAVSSSYIGLLHWGLAGAAAGPMVSGAATLLASFIFAGTRFGFRLPFGPMLGILASASIMAGVIASLPYTVNPWTLASYCVAGAVIYGVCALAFVPVCRRLALGGIGKLRAARR